MNEELTIDKEFSTLFRKQTAEERKEMAARMEMEGGVHEIRTWANHDDTIIDGHNAYEVCQELGLAYKAVGMRFESREEVIEWMLRNQLGRRNLSDKEKKDAIGRLYKQRKKTVGGQKGNENAAKNNADNLSPSFSRTAEQVAKEHGVSAKQVHRAEKFCDAVDELAAVDPEIKDAILSGKVKASDKDILELAAAPEETKKAVVEQVTNGHAKSLSAAMPKRKGNSVDEINSLALDLGKVRKRLKGLTNQDAPWVKEVRECIEKAVSVTENTLAKARGQA